MQCCTKGGHVNCESAFRVVFADDKTLFTPVDAALGMGPSTGVDCWMRRCSCAAFMAMKPRIRICAPCSHVSELSKPRSECWHHSACSRQEDLCLLRHDPTPQPRPVCLAARHLVLSACFYKGAISASRTYGLDPPGSGQNATPWLSCSRHTATNASLSTFRASVFERVTPQFM